jgi:hypothetical protein
MSRWRQVAEKVQAAADRFQFDPGRDFKKVVLYGMIDTGAGNEDNCFTPWWFSLGDARHIGQYLYFTILFAQNNDSFSLDQLKEMARWVEKRCAFSEYCGFEEFGALARDVMGVLDEVETKEAFVELLTPLRLYAALMNQWSYHYFPYAVGYLLPLQDEAFFEEGLRLAKKP